MPVKFKCLELCKDLISQQNLQLLEQVLSELTAAEVKDSKTLSTLLEPFLLDALKQSGRQSPHDAKSDQTVEGLCQQIFEDLSKETEGTGGFEEQSCR
eukprot:Skav200766  [mRNA]  locus=scaffold2001:358400:358693:+ [translate_table: standard]